jgi:hypothetical protein
MRIIDEEKLVKLRKSLRAFGAAVAASGGFKDEAAIAKQLDQFGFTGSKIVTAYTRPFSVQPK